jgi:hypothetical protein
MLESRNWTQELVRSIELACIDYQQNPDQDRREKRLKDAIKQSLSSRGFETEKEHLINVPALLFHKEGHIDGGNNTLWGRSCRIQDVTVDIWRLPRGKYNVSIAFTEYSGKDVLRPAVDRAEAERIFQRRISELKKGTDKPPWYPPYAHKVDLWIRRPEKQGPLPFAALEVEIATLRQHPPRLDVESYSNFGEDITLMGWATNEMKIPFAIVLVMFNTDAEPSGLSGLQEAVEQCENESRLIKDNLFREGKDCYIYFTTSRPSEFKPCWKPHRPTTWAARSLG